jgi:glutamate synthase (NADPH/NADH) large chain
MVGRVDMLEMNKAINHWKQDSIDLSAILTPAENHFRDAGTYQSIKQDHQLEEQLDLDLIEKSKAAIENDMRVQFESSITNVDRAVGAMLSSHVVKARQGNNLKEDSIQINFQGSAGQSFGAFLAQGITMSVEGDANDYVGKGLSGGRVIVYPPKDSTYSSENEIIAGNVCGYGATGGELYLSGQVAERFCVRNSGLIAVVEGIGDHGCEYMTGGRAVILGEVGRNFGAGMSGGIAYVYDPNQTLESRANAAMIDFDPMDKESLSELRELATKHLKYTGSKIAEKILDNWDKEAIHFIKVMPKALKAVLAAQDKKHLKAV